MGQEIFFLAIIIPIILFMITMKILDKPRKPKLRLPNLTPPENGRPTGELARRLGCGVDILATTPINYRQFAIEKRSGGHRYIQAPDASLKKIQRTILKRLLNKLPTHPAATGFAKGHSIVSNAFPHIDADVILRMDIKTFFRSTTENRLRSYLYVIGWDQESTDILIRLCTYHGSLPQGAPTSPRLSNLINYELDARLDGWAKKVGAVYTRYADDITFSFYDIDCIAPFEAVAQNPKTLEKVPQTIQGNNLVASTIQMTKKILAEYEYDLHMKRKLNIRRRHQQQKVTGLVVNKCVALPRKTRRWLRSVEHHLETGKAASLTPQQLQGWQAFEKMVKEQTDFLTSK
ncbi:MAG: reverse transcriptase family protein [Planctomycetota bacterium]